MTKQELAATIADFKSLKVMADELASEIEALGDVIKREMGEATEEYIGDYKVTYKPVSTTRVDTTALKKELPEVAARYSKTTVARRLVIA